MKETITTILKSLVFRTSCKPGWSFEFEEEDGHFKLLIFVTGPNSRAKGHVIRVCHSFPVPYATYNEKSWRRWIFEMCRRVENHEMSEWFMIDNVRVFAPLHGPGEDPYTIHEIRSDEEARTNQDGSINS